MTPSPRKRPINENRSRLLQNAWANSYPTDEDIARLQEKIDNLSVEELEDSQDNDESDSHVCIRIIY